MAIGWQLIDDFWYYFDTNGKVVTNAWIGDCYVNESGVWDMSIYHPQWKESQGRWWYQHSDGKYTMADWEYLEGKWYYFDEEGWMVTGWYCINDKWYYMDAEGAKVTNAWIGNYYVKDDGVMATSEWVDEGRYYVDEMGIWVSMQISIVLSEKRSANKMAFLFRFMQITEWRLTIINIYFRIDKQNEEFLFAME